LWPSVAKRAIDPLLHGASGAAREAWRSKFERDVDPEGALSVEERLRRAEMARKAHFARLALASARARAKKQTGRIVPGNDWQLHGSSS
jgi:hypothetical protein